MVRKLADCSLNSTYRVGSYIHIRQMNGGPPVRSQPLVSGQFLQAGANLAVVPSVTLKRDAKCWQCEVHVVSPNLVLEQIWNTKGFQDCFNESFNVSSIADPEFCVERHRKSVRTASSLAARGSAVRVPVCLTTFALKRLATVAAVLSNAVTRARHGTELSVSAGSNNVLDATSLADCCCGVELATAATAIRLALPLLRHVLTITPLTANKGTRWAVASLRAIAWWASTMRTELFATSQTTSVWTTPACHRAVPSYRSCRSLDSEWLRAGFADFHYRRSAWCARRIRLHRWVRSFGAEGRAAANSAAPTLYSIRPSCYHVEGDSDEQAH